MPFSLKRARGKELYWVVTTETGKKHSKKPLPYKTAEAQRRALYASMKGGALSEIVLKAIELLKRGLADDIVKDSLRLYAENATEQQLYQIIQQAKEHILNGAGEKLPTLEKQGSAYAIVYKGQTLSRFASKKDALDELNTYVDKKKLARADKQLVDRRRTAFGPSSDEGYDAELAELRGGGIHDTLRSSWFPAIRTARDKRAIIAMLYTALSSAERSQLDELTYRLVGIPFFEAIRQRYDIERIIQDIVNPPERLAAPVPAPPAPRFVAPQVQAQVFLQNPIPQVERVEHLNPQAQEFVPRLSRHTEAFIPEAERALLPKDLLEGGQLTGGGGWKNALRDGYGEILVNARPVLTDQQYSELASRLQDVLDRAEAQLNSFTMFQRSGIRRDLSFNDVATGNFGIQLNQWGLQKARIVLEASMAMIAIAREYNTPMEPLVFPPGTRPILRLAQVAPAPIPVARVNDECPICQTDFEQLTNEGVGIHTGTCGHAVCQPDYDQILPNPRTGMKPCPMCRAQPYGGKLKFVKKYLKGRGIPATKGNVKSVMDAMDAEGVVFE